VPNAPEPPPAPDSGVTDAIIEEEVQSHWLARVFGPVRRLYEWVLGWAETRHAGKAMGALAFSEAIFFPVPADLLLVALCMGRPARSFRWAAICTFWSIVGGMTAWGLGTVLGRPALETLMGYLGRQALVEEADVLFKQWGFLAVGASALTPIPYMVFSWVAGTLSLPWWKFLLASALFRPLRFLAVAALAYTFGERAKQFIDKYFNLCTILFMLLVIGVVLLLKLL
jgi:membrane protein YqaA with SNARE-associated domain